MSSTTVTEFNNMLIDLASQLAVLCPSSIIANNIDVLTHIVKKKPKVVIDAFVLYVLKYKQRIDAGDEDFFLNNSFDSEISDVEKRTNENDLVKKAFEFKAIWKQLSQQNRDIVKQYMQYMCQLALTYIS